MSPDILMTCGFLSDPLWILCHAKNGCPLLRSGNSDLLRCTGLTTRAPELEHLIKGISLRSYGRGVGE